MMRRSIATLLADLIQKICVEEHVPMMDMPHTAPPETPPDRFWFCRRCRGVMPLDTALIGPEACLGMDRGGCQLPPDVF